MTTETQPTLKDVGTRTAVLAALADVINTELKASKAELQQRLKAAKEDTGTQQIGLSLPDGQDVGKASLVQPKPAAVIVDEKAFLAWVSEVRPGEIVRRFVTEVRPAWAALVLKEITAAGVARWCDKDTGELHDVPGVQLEGRAAYTRMTIPDEGHEAIAASWRNGQLAGLGLPQLTAGTGGEQ